MAAERAKLPVPLMNSYMGTHRLYHSFQETGHPTQVYQEDNQFYTQNAMPKIKQG